jgi:hypothetical protein
VLFLSYSADLFVLKPNVFNIELESQHLAFFLLLQNVELPSVYRKLKLPIALREVSFAFFGDKELIVRRNIPILPQLRKVDCFSWLDCL